MSGQGATGRRRRWVAAALALGASFGAGELVVRLTVGEPVPERLPLLRIRAHPTRGWEMVPGELHYTYGHAVRVNALGLRGAELAPKAPDERRVLALGDSLVYGQGVADGDTLPRQLERALEELATGTEAARWSVVNGGLRAYATHQELALLEELGPRIAPDVVVLFWFQNDLLERDLERTHARLTASGPVLFDTGEPAEPAHLRGWHLRQALRRSALLMLLHDWVVEDEGDELDRLDTGPAFERLGAHLERFAERCAGLGAAPLVAILPAPGAVHAPEAPRPLDERALALARERGLPVLDLAPALVAAFGDAERLPVIPFDGHWNAAANVVLARAVASRLLEGVVPGATGAPPG